MTRFVVRPEDANRDWSVARAALRAAAEAVKRTGKPYQIEIKPWAPLKTDPQNRTLWKWHTEVASQLTERCRMAGHTVKWDKTDVHEHLFKPRFMPSRERMLPDGELLIAPMGTSDPDCTSAILSNAMDQYLAWIYGEGMEVTIPDEQWAEEMCRRVG